MYLLMNEAPLIIVKKLSNVYDSYLLFVGDLSGSNI